MKDRNKIFVEQGPIVRKAPAILYTKKSDMCVITMIYDPDEKIAGMLHSPNKETTLNLLPKLIEEMKRVGAKNMISLIAGGKYFAWWSKGPNNFRITGKILRKHEDIHAFKMGNLRGVEIQSISVDASTGKVTYISKKSRKSDIGFREGTFKLNRHE